MEPWCGGCCACVHTLATAATRRHRDLPLLAVFGVTVGDPVAGDLASGALHLRGLESAVVAEFAAWVGGKPQLRARCRRSPPDAGGRVDGVWRLGRWRRRVAPHGLAPGRPRGVCGAGGGERSTQRWRASDGRQRTIRAWRGPQRTEQDSRGGVYAGGPIACNGYRRKPLQRRLFRHRRCAPTCTAAATGPKS
jgi:hypothetical protein